MASYFQYYSGIGNVGSYQASGIPFVSGGINVYTQTLNGNPYEVSFPSVSRWIIVKNHDLSSGKSVKVAGSITGLASDNYITVFYDKADYRASSTPRMELKMTKLYLTGSSRDVDIIVGLTGIESGSIIDNWAGTEGIG